MMNRWRFGPGFALVALAILSGGIRPVEAQRETDDYPVISPFEAERYVGQFVIVEGRIVQVAWTRNATFLNYRRYTPGSRDFYLVIVGSDRDRFDREVVESWEGKVLRVRGRVELYRGRPQIRLRSPTQVTVAGEARARAVAPRVAGRRAEKPAPGEVRLTFHGAARSIGGSCILVETATSRVLLDIGAFYGDEESRDPFEFPFYPETINAVILSHAHMDHVGRLPHLVVSGFRGKAFCTEVTRELALLMLRQELRFAEDDRLRRIGDIELAGPVVATGYHDAFPVTDDITCTFLDAGHIPGSAVCVLEIATNEGVLRVAYTGDYGNGYHPLLRQPEKVRQADVLIVEATYGGEHREIPPDPYAGFVQQLGEQIRQGRRVIIPSFVLDRTQKLLWAIGLAKARGRIPPDVPVYLTSGTAARITSLYEQWWRIRGRFAQYFSPAWLTQPHPWHGVQYRRANFSGMQGLTAPPRPSITIASSADGRYAASHDLIRKLAGDPDTAFFVVGYAPPDTPVGQLAAIAHAQQPRRLRMDGEELPVRAVVRRFSVFSGHADQDQMTAFVTACHNRQRVFVVHGEEENCLRLADRLEQELPEEVRVRAPEPGERVTIPLRQPAAVQ